MLADRTVVITAQTILELFKDYMTEEYIPATAKLVKVMMNQQERKLAIVIDDPSIRQDAPPIEVRFENRRMFASAGGNA